MRIFTVEAFDGDGFQLVICTLDEQRLKGVSPNDYDTHLLVVKVWENDEIIHSYRVELSNMF